MKNVALSVAVLVALAGTAMADDVSYSTPNVASTPSGLVDSWSGTFVAAGPFYRRAEQSANTNEISPNAPTALAAAGNYRYGTHAFTPATSGLYTFYSAQSLDGYLHLYSNSFDSTNALTNVLAGDDDMATLNGGTVPNRNGVTSTNDSGFQYNLVAGQQYVVTTSTYSGTSTAAGSYYNEIRGGGSPGSFTAIPDNAPTAGANIVLNIANANTITSMNSVDLFGLSHTYLGDIIMTLTHNDTGTSVVLINRPNSDGTTQGTGNNGGDLNGDYHLVDGGAGWGTATTIAAGNYGTANPLSAFVGETMGGTWTLNITDSANADVGGLFAFGLSATVTPTPGAAALLGLGGLALGRRRRA